MSLSPIISVLMPTYNRVSFIQQALDSVIAQDYRSLEIIVVDDGSTDNTRDLIASNCNYVNTVKYFYQENQGISAARNRCLELATGDYIAWLDSDDYYLPGKLSAQYNYLVEHPECAMVFSLYENFADSAFDFSNFSCIGLDKNDCYHLTTSLAKRDLYEKCGIFTVEYPIAEDFDYVLRLKMIFGMNLKCINRLFYKRRSHGGNIMRSPLHNHELIKTKIVADNFKKNNTTTNRIL